MMLTNTLAGVNWQEQPKESITYLTYVTSSRLPGRLSFTFSVRYDRYLEEKLKANPGDAAETSPE